VGSPASGRRGCVGLIVWGRWSSPPRRAVTNSRRRSVQPGRSRSCTRCAVSPHIRGALLLTRQGRGTRSTESSQNPAWDGQRDRLPGGPGSSTTEVYGSPPKRLHWWGQGPLPVLGESRSAKSVTFNLTSPGTVTTRSGGPEFRSSGGRRSGHQKTTSRSRPRRPARSPPTAASCGGLYHKQDAVPR